MTDLPPYDTSLDLGGLPGGDILFTDPVSPGAGEPLPAAAVRPTGATAYGVHSARPAEARPTEARPIQTRPVGPAAPTTTAQRRVPERRQAGPTRRRRGRAAWPLIAVLFGVVPAGVHAIRGYTDVAPGHPQTSVAAAQDAGGGAVVDDVDMTIYRPHSIRSDSQGVTMHVDAPGGGGSSYTITLNGSPMDTDVTTARDYGVDDATEPTDALIASSDTTARIRCEIRDGHGALVAVGEATGILECVYDPAELLE